MGAGVGARRHKLRRHAVERLLGGGQLGYNWQFSDRFIAGLEADLQGAGVRGGGGFQTLTPAAIYPPFVAATNVTVHRSLEYFGTLRGRLGYAVTPTMLFYATGGLAYGGVATSTAINQSFIPSLLCLRRKERFLRQPRRLDGRRRRGISADQ